MKRLLAIATVLLFGTMSLFGIEVKVSAGGNHSLLLKSDGTLWGFGLNSAGQLGDGTLVSKSTPVKIMSDVSSISAGHAYSLVLKSDGTLWGFGSNEVGQLGDGTTTNRPTPVQVMTDVYAVSAGLAHSLVIKKDGTLWSFGLNRAGQLGDGTTTNRFIPAQIMTDISAASAGLDHSLAIKEDGTLWSFGSNKNGQLGDDATTSRSTPAQVMTDASIASAGRAQHSLVIKKDGTLWSFGHGERLGDGGTVDKFTPVKIMTNVANISVGDFHSLVIKKDGTLWGFGTNNLGQLGDGTTGNKLTPVKIMSNVFTASAGNAHSLVIKKDGTLWGFGYNYDGRIGQISNADTTTYAVSLTPIQIMSIGALDINTISATSATTSETTSSITLKTGWNMISSPLVGQKIDTALLTNNGITAIWAFDSFANKYTAPSSIETNVGYWVLSASDKTLSLTSAYLSGSSTTSSIDSAAINRWNLLGTPTDTTKTQLKSKGATAVWWYDPTIGNYSQSDTIKAGSGFWLWSNTGMVAAQTSTSTTTGSSTALLANFYIPTKAACTAARGIWNTEYNECSADWYKAMQICTMPTKEQWLAVFIECGAAMPTLSGVGYYSVATGVSGMSSCMKNKSFVYYSPYWSSSDYDTNFAWHAQGYEEQNQWGIGNNYSKGNHYFVRCVTNQTTSSTTTAATNQLITYISGSMPNTSIATSAVKSINISGFTDPNGYPLTYTATSNPSISGVAVSGTAITFPSNIPVGNYTITVTAESGKGSKATGSFKLTVSEAVTGNAPVQTGSATFRKPSQAECEAGGGHYSGNECWGYWETGMKICSMPSKDDWLSVLSSCGANIAMNDLGQYGSSTDRHGNTISTPGLVACMTGKGFMPKNAKYCSSTESYDPYSGADGTWQIEYGAYIDGESWKVVRNYKGSNYAIRCK